MAYLALYREWRPQKFQDMVGQQHVTKTLTNALRQGRIAHAYLFSGPRGTGKTTAAKILAKALNCEQRPLDLGQVEPCNECPSCLSIDQGSAMEVLEIDAASNRGIDEIRDLREKVNLSTAKDKYKVYIIDEVHMLTTEAFNALLKTLEEPPQKVVFILATTEVHKIPLTILSRVQRFEFHRIAVPEIETRLDEVCQALGRQVDPEALHIIAQKSEGGLRDALSILDQCLLSAEVLGMEDVYQVLGMAGEEFSFQLVDALLTGNYAQALECLSQGVNQGRDPRQIVRELLDYLRQTLLCLTTGENPAVAAHLKERVKDQAAKIGMDRLLSWISVLLQGEGQLKYAGNARLAAELLLVQAIYDQQKTTRNISLDDHQPAKTGGVSQGLHEIAKKNSLNIPEGNHIARDPDGQNTNKTLPKEEGPLKEGAGKSAVSLKMLQEKWPEVLENVRKRKKSTHAFLLEGKPEFLANNTVTLVFREGFSFHKDKVDQPENKQTIEGVLQELMGVNLKLNNIMENEKPKPLEDSEEKSKAEAVIKKAEDIFGVDLVVVKDEDS